MVILLMPAVSVAEAPTSTNAITISNNPTRESLEEQKIVLLKQIILLLQKQVEQLMALVGKVTPQPIVLGVSASNEGSEVKSEKPRRRGGSSSNRRAASDTAATVGGTVNAVPVCNISSDNSVYMIGDSITLTWESTNAVKAYFETDFGGKDYQTPPGEGADVATSGTAVVLANVLGSPTVQLIIVSINNEERNCTVQFSVEKNVTTTEDQQAMISSLVSQVEELGGDTSSVPTEAEIAEMTTEERHQLINDLLKQIAELEANETEVQTVAVCPYKWVRDLSLGSTGADVLKLQQFLNQDPDTQIAATGESSKGNETDTYTQLIAEAIAKFQVKYRREILDTQALINPTGEFDPSTRYKANSLCDAAPVVQETEDEG